MTTISKRRVWAWDTFAGMPDDGYIPHLDASDPPGKWTPNTNPILAFAKTGLDIIPIVGKYSFTIPRFPVDTECPTCKHREEVKFAFVHIDCDHYEAYRRVLEFVTPRMSLGGVIRLDDYHSCAGAKKATDEWCARTGKTLTTGEWIRF